MALADKTLADNSSPKEKRNATVITPPPKERKRKREQVKQARCLYVPGVRPVAEEGDNESDISDSDAEAPPLMPKANYYVEPAMAKTDPGVIWKPQDYAEDLD